MAAKVTAPNANIFTSDPLEQIAAKGVMDRDMSGLANMFLYAFGQQREAGQDAYMAGLRGANQMALREAQMEQQQKMMEQLLKSGTDLAKEGYEVGQMPIMSSMFRDPTNQDVVAKIWRQVQQSKIAEANAKAANAGGDNVTIKTDVSPGGMGYDTVTTKGRSEADARAKHNAALNNLRTGRTGGKTDEATADSMLKRRTYNQ